MTSSTSSPTPPTRSPTCWPTASARWSSPLGGKGAWHHSADGTIHRPALPVTVVDSIGAGDAFVSGYLSATLDNLSPEARLTRATTSGAFCVGAHGDWESLPTREDLTLLTHAHGTALR